MFGDDHFAVTDRKSAAAVRWLHPSKTTREAEKGAAPPDAQPPARVGAVGRLIGTEFDKAPLQNAVASISLALLASKNRSGLMMIGGIFSPAAYWYMMSNALGPNRGLHSQVAPSLPSMIA
jgi:hypothetical protein